MRCVRVVGREAALVSGTDVQAATHARRPGHPVGAVVPRKIIAGPASAFQDECSGCRKYLSLDVNTTF